MKKLRTLRENVRESRESENARTVVGFQTNSSAKRPKGADRYRPKGVR